MKRLAFLIIVISIFLAGQGWAATWYVSKSGNAAYDGTAYVYDGSHGPKLTIAQGIALMSKGDTLKVGGGTYNEGIVLTANGTGDEEANRYTIDAYGDGEVIVMPTSAGSYALDFQGDYWYVNRLILDGSGRATLSDCVRFYQGDNSRLNYCISRGFIPAAAYSVKIHTTTGVQINNCEISGNLGGGLYLTSSSTATVRNTNICGNNRDQSVYGLKIDAGNTLDIDYSLCFGNGYDVAKNVSNAGTLTAGANFFTDRAPGYMAYRKPYLFGITFDDDAGSLTYVKDIAAYALPYGIHLSRFVLEVSLLPTANHETDLQALVAAGHGVYIHGQSHQDLTKLNAINIQYTGAAASASITIAGNTVTLTTAGGVDDHTIDISLDGLNDRTDHLVSTIDGYANWTCTKHADANFATKTIGLVNTTVDLTDKASHLLLWDQTNMPVNEVGLCQAWLASFLSYTPTVMAWPYGLSGAAVWPVVRDSLSGAGYSNMLGARGTNAATGKYIDSVTLFCVDHVTPALTGTETTVRTATKQYLEWIKANGKVLCFVTHNSTEIPTANWAWILDEVNNAHMTCLTYKELVDAVLADHSTSDNLAWTKSYTDAYNFRKTRGSYCINTGVAITGLSTDIAGKPIVGTPDIGAYENQGNITAADLTLGPMTASGEIDDTEGEGGATLNITAADLTLGPMTMTGSLRENTTRNITDGSLTLGPMSMSANMREGELKGGGGLGLGLTPAGNQFMRRR